MKTFLPWKKCLSWIHKTSSPKQKSNFFVTYKQMLKSFTTGMSVNFNELAATLVVFFYDDRIVIQKARHLTIFHSFNVGLVGKTRNGKESQSLMVLVEGLALFQQLNNWLLPALKTTGND